MTKYRRNGKIDLLKFLFAVVIVLHHGTKFITSAKNPLYTGGSLAVEFFFIVSGYLLMASISRLPAPSQPLGCETGKFIWRKFKGLYPEVAIAFLVGFVLELIISDKTLQQLWEMSFQNLFLLKMTGIGLVNINAQTWYLSSMLLCMVILFPLLRKYPEMMSRVVLPLTAILLLGYFAINKTHPRDPSAVWKEFTYKGNLRAMAELSIGISLYPLVQKLKRINLSTFTRILIFIAEWACYIAVYFYMRNKTATRLDYYYIAVLSVAILLSFSEQGIDVGWFQSRFFSYLGKFSFALYLSHYCWAINMNTLFPDLSVKKQFLLYIAISFLIAAVIMILSALIQRVCKALKEPVQKLLLAKDEQTIS